MHVCVPLVVSCSQSYHYHLLWPTLLTWHHKRFSNDGFFLVAHISNWLLCLCTFALRACLLVYFQELWTWRVSTEWSLCTCCWEIAELLLDVAICCWSGLVELRVHRWEIQPWCSSVVSQQQERWPLSMPLNLLCSCCGVFVLLHWLLLCYR